jgi:hypothetical protein
MLANLEQLEQKAENQNGVISSNCDKEAHDFCS